MAGLQRPRGAGLRGLCLSACFALATVVPAAAAAPAPGAPLQPVVVDLSVGADGLLDWRVTLPAGLRRLDFVLRNPGLRQAFKSLTPIAADGCGVLDDTGVALREGASPAACPVLHWRLQPRLLARWATYEAAQPLSQGGVLLYTGYFALAAPGHALHWRFSPPVGGRAWLEGRPHDRTVLRTIGAEDTTRALAAALGPLPGEAQGAGLRSLLTQQYVLLSNAPTLPLPGGTLVHDAQAPAALVSAVRDALQAHLQAFAQAYGVVPAGPVAVVLTLADERGFHGDVSDGRMMRLRVDASAPPLDGPPLQQLRRFVAHEVAHWWNMGIYRSDPEQPWLHEGHADWAALLALHASGQIDAAGLRAELQAAFNGCLLARARQPAASLPRGYGGNDNHYACGMSLMALAQAMVLARTPAAEPATAAPPLALLAGLHQTGGAVLGADGFADWADGTPGGAMARLLTDPALSFDAGFRSLAARAGLAQVHALDEPGAAVPRGLRSALAGRLMQQLMSADCGGAYSFWTESDHLRLADKLHCKTLRTGSQVLAVQGLPLLAQPGAAWAAVTQACAQGLPLRVDYRQGPHSLTPCAAPWPEVPLGHYVTLQAQALQRLGLQAP